MCDTFVCTGSATADGSVIFGKNSDREPNEAQILEYRKPAVYGKGEEVKCTYISIPQVKRHTEYFFPAPSGCTERRWVPTGRAL